MFQRSPERKAVRLLAIKTIFSRKNAFAATKIQKQAPYVFCKRGSLTLLLERDSIIIAKCLRTLIWKKSMSRCL